MKIQIQNETKAEKERWKEEKKLAKSFHIYKQWQLVLKLSMKIAQIHTTKFPCAPLWLLIISICFNFRNPFPHRLRKSKSILGLQRNFTACALVSPFTEHRLRRKQWMLFSCLSTAYTAQQSACDDFRFIISLKTSARISFSRYCSEIFIKTTFVRRLIN